MTYLDAPQSPVKRAISACSGQAAVETRAGAMGVLQPVSWRHRGGAATARAGSCSGGRRGHACAPKVDRSSGCPASWVDDAAGRADHGAPPGTIFSTWKLNQTCHFPRSLQSRSWHQCKAHACGMHDSHASWLVPVIRSCQSPIWIWLVNHLHPTTQCQGGMCTASFCSTDL